jgi:hypothetical protein
MKHRTSDAFCGTAEGVAADRFLLPGEQHRGRAIRTLSTTAQHRCHGVVGQPSST